MKINQLIVASSIIASLALVSCSGGEKNEDENGIGKDSVATSTETNTPSSYETFFQVPSPGEMLTFIKSVGKKDSKNVAILNKTDNISKYTDNKTKSLNFGIYTTDLSYCSIFNMGAETIKYFKVVKQLGDQLGLSATIQPEIMERLQKNLENSDSLSLITDDLYFSTFETLESGKQGQTLALVVTGGWIESMYLAVSMVDKFNANSPVVQRIADQKYTLENLIEFLKKYEGSSEDVKQVKADMDALMVAFNLLKEEKLSGNGLKQDGKKKLIEGGVQLIIDEKTFTDIKNKIISIRQSYSANQ